MKMPQAGPTKVPRVTFLDGGLVANNPTKYAYLEISLLHGHRDPALVLSIGTGQKQKRPFKMVLLEHWRPFLSHQLNNRIAESEEADAWMKLVEERRRDQLEYERLTVSLDCGLGWMKLDEWKKRAPSKTPDHAPAEPGQYTKLHDYFREKKSKHHDTVEFLEARTKLYLAQKEVGAQLDRLARLLVKRRQKRSRTPEWKYFATGET